jgi:cation transport ATPase
MIDASRSVMTALRLHVHGMDCADEAALVRRALGAVPGVSRLEFDLVTGHVEVLFDPAQTSTDAILAATRRTGLLAHLPQTAHPPHDIAHEEAAHDHAHDHHSTRWTIASGALMVAGWVVEGFRADDWLDAFVGHGHVHDPRASILYGLAAFAGLWPMLPRVWASVRHRQLDMHVLVCLSVIGAGAIGEWSEGAAVAFLFALAHWMEGWSIDRARAALHELVGPGSVLVSEGMRHAAPTERWIERFAAVYTPLVTGAALLVAFVPPLFDQAWAVWFYRGLVFLVLGCPCALVISTPVTVVAALTSAARRGVLVKGGAPLERAALASSGALAALSGAGVAVASSHDGGAALALADVVLLPQASAVAPDFLVRHARRAMSVIRQNVGIALATKLVFLVFAALGSSPLWLAVLADTGATVIVTLNGLRLLRSRA